MIINIKKQDDEIKIVIQDEMTIYTVLEQKNSLLPLTEAEHHLHVDLAGVSEIDSAGIQLLIHLKQESIRKGGSLHLVNHSRSVVEVLTLFDMSSFFGDPLIIPAEWSKS